MPRCRRRGHWRRHRTERPRLAPKIRRGGQPVQLSRPATAGALLTHFHQPPALQLGDHLHYPWPGPPHPVQQPLVRSARPAEGVELVGQHPRRPTQLSRASVLAFHPLTVFNRAPPTAGAAANSRATSSSRRGVAGAPQGPPRSAPPDRRRPDRRCDGGATRPPPPGQRTQLQRGLEEDVGRRSQQPVDLRRRCGDQPQRVDLPEFVTPSPERLEARTGRDVIHDDDLRSGFDVATFRDHPGKFVDELDRLDVARNALRRGGSRGIGGAQDGRQEIARGASRAGSGVGEVVRASRANRTSRRE